MTPPASIVRNIPGPLKRTDNPPARSHMGLGALSAARADAAKYVRPVTWGE